MRADRERFRITNEALSAIKDVKNYPGLEESFSAPLKNHRCELLDFGG